MRICRFIRHSGLLFLCLLIQAADTRASDESVDDFGLALKIRKKVEEIHAVRMESLRLHENHKQETGGVEQQIARLEEQLEKGNAAAEQERQSVERLRINIEKLKQDVQLIREMFVEISEKALTVAGSVRKYIEKGIPFHKQQRLSRVKQMLGDLRNSEIVTKGKALIALYKFIAEELRFGRSVDIWNEPVIIENGAVEKHSFQIRIGLVTQVFISEDGQSTGIAAKKKDTDWNVDIKNIYLPYLQKILSILRNRRPPEIIPVPISVADDARDKE